MGVDGNGTAISMRMELLHPKTELGLGDPRHVASLKMRLIVVPLGVDGGVAP
jgi:hypothetical protein